jgi:hypothetical protein
MKQLLLVKSGATVLSAAAANTAQRAKGNIAIIDNGDYYSIYTYNGDNLPPTGQDVVWKKNLEITKTLYSAAVPFSAVFTVPTPADNTDYVVLFTKKGAVFNQRDVWTTSARKTATANTAALVAAQLAKNINKFSQTSGITATVSGAVITCTADTGLDYAVKFFSEAADNTTSNIAVTVTAAKLGVADKAYVQALAQKCISDRGINYTEQMGKELYKDYANDVEDVQYTIWNLRYYNPKHDHRIDEPLYQMLHIAVPAGVTIDIKTPDEATTAATAGAGSGS